MGKSTTTWIKSIFRGKKSSKSNLSYGSDILKSANKEEILISSKAPVADTTVEHTLVSQMTPAVGAKSGMDLENGVASKSPDEGFTFSVVQGDVNAQGVTNMGLHEDSERIRHETAATKAQAAVRGYLARCEFRKLKGIIRLQALIRGHLVRRQAVATLYCVWAIVKFQALVRGQKVRRSTIGIEVQNACNLGKIQGTKSSISSGTCTSTVEDKLIKNVFAQKLLASSKGGVPLSLQYTWEELNSSHEWLDRWTRSGFWEPHSRKTKNVKHAMLQKAETKPRRPKRGIQKLSGANTENSSGRSAKESSKTKRNPRKLSGHPVGSVQENSQNEFDKVNNKTSDSTKERFDIDSRKEKPSLRKSSIVATGVSEGTNDAELATTPVSEVNTGPKLTDVYGQVGALPACQDSELEPSGNNVKVDDGQVTNKQINHKDHYIGSENQKIRERRASFPPNIEHQENGVHAATKVPSYMAPTESARAKLRGQGSPRFSEDAIENSTAVRRFSLPSSANGKYTSMSPRAQKLVHAAGKGMIKSDRSLSASRDGTVPDKMVKAEWRR